MMGAWFNWKDAQAAIVYRDNLPEGATKELNYANDLIEFHKETARDYLWWAGAIWLINVLDAWIDAHLYDVRVYTPPASLGESKGAPQIAPNFDAGSTRYLSFSVGF